ILQMVEAVIQANPAQVEQYKAGKTAVLQFFVGQLMKQSRGKANPQTAIKLFQEKLSQ
ncbi:MAG: Asp-tRNA(Asn)/Glu-tRNA(Gln) amidotransferase GatCAB subunit B, partial [Lentisphaeria bacterium]|nr:Asp-tRNA(Asn)/Glu-tRNA(Gln) amidotransferase GatCAB subunit B [Lentisphaeria bacterium]